MTERVYSVLKEASHPMTLIEIALAATGRESTGAILSALCELTDEGRAQITSGYRLDGTETPKEAGFYAM